MIDALVTGGTGFVGANVVRELLAQRRSVRVLARPRGDRRALAGLDVEICEGDLLDSASVRRAVKGVNLVFHVAADYRLWARDPEDLHRVNVGGTRAVLEAAGEAGAFACDMESAVILEWARARGIPAAVIRAVSDTAERGVPADLAAVVEPDGRVRTMRAVRAVLARPRAFADALTLRNGTHAALRTVAHALGRIAKDA